MNCHGCGAVLTDVRCRYCLRPASAEQCKRMVGTQYPDPKKDPKRNAEPRKELR